jgi:predicted RND superfamily exporter protein
VSWLLRLMATGVERRPGTLLVLLGAVTLVAIGLASQLDVETDITEFAADTPLAQGFDTIEERFGTRGSSIQVIIDAGRGGNSLSADGLATAERVVEIAERTPEVAANLAPEGLTGPAVVSYAAPITPRLEGFDDDLSDLPETFVSSFVIDALLGTGERIEPLLSSDADLERGNARAGLAVVNLDADLGDAERRETSLALRDALAAEDFGWFDVRPFSFDLLTEDIEQGLFEDLPMLLGISFLLVIAILWLLFRRASDVILGFAALGLSIIWMAGAAAALGPGVLGLTGAFSQIAVAVPVLLVGLGIDYTVHLVARYRENRTAGAAPPASARIAMLTVGVALVLATMTTVAGFLSNLATPLPPIADFGVFAAAGIVAAFVVTGLLVPGVRALLDGRRAEPDGTPDGAVTETGLDRIGPPLGRLAGLAVSAPVLVLAAAGLLAIAGIAAASDLDTEFSQEDFIPAESEAAALIHLMDGLFGGDVSERTHVLVEGDLTDPTLANAVLEARERMADTPDVVTAGGVADVSSAPTLIELIVDEAAQAAEGIATQLDFYADPEAAARGLPLPTIRGPEDLPPQVRDEAAGGFTGAFGGDLTRLERRLPGGLDLGDALLGAVPAATIDAALREGLGEQLRSEPPGGADRATLAAAAALEPGEIDRATLTALGFPVEELDGGSLDLIDAAAELRELGWDGERITSGTDVDALYGVVAREAPTELQGVLTPDGRSGLISVATTAGQPRAEELTAALRADLAPIEVAGGEILVASEPLLIEETLATLADAQTLAIVVSLLAAALIIIGFYWFDQRRPVLGVIAMVPSLLAVVFTLGSMWVLGLAYNALTATVAAIAIGIGVPYGIHITNRFVEDRRVAETSSLAIGRTVRNTGAALVGSAVTTASAFGVLALSNLAPLRQFGAITGIMIVFALVSALLAETSCLVLWDRYHRRRDADAAQPVVEPSTAGVA